MLRVDRPLVSRVREIRTHGLKGGVGSLLNCHLAMERTNVYQ